MVDIRKPNGKHAPKSAVPDIRLLPVNSSDQPVLANYSRANVANGMVFLDFGFLEPAAVSEVTRRRRTGAKIPAKFYGRLAARIALPYVTLVRLNQQLAPLIGKAKSEHSTGAASVTKDQ